MKILKKSNFNSEIIIFLWLNYYKLFYFVVWFNINYYWWFGMKWVCLNIYVMNDYCYRLVLNVVYCDYLYCLIDLLFGLFGYKYF